METLSISLCLPARGKLSNHSSLPMGCLNAGNFLAFRNGVKVFPSHFMTFLNKIAHKLDVQLLHAASRKQLARKDVSQSDCLKE